MLKYPLGTLIRIKDNFKGGIAWSAGFWGIIISYNDNFPQENMKDHYIVYLFYSKKTCFPSIVFAEHHELEFIK